MQTTVDLMARIEVIETELAQLKALAAAADAFKTNDPPATDTGGRESTLSSRRNLFRYGAAAVGAAVAGLSAGPAEGADGGPVLIGSSNTGTATTILTTTSGVGFWAVSGGVYGLIGEGAGIGTYGATHSTSPSGAGVQGVSFAGTGQAAGVYGYAGSPNAPAVYGTNSVGGNAVRAEVPAASTSNAIALYALNYSTYTGGAPGAGGFGVYGLSAKGHGLVGATAAAGAAAVVGATNGVAGAYAAAFYGPVIVSGNFTVVGGAKSAAVPHPDGSHRRLYCVESAESWFEDFGEGTLVCGEASIPLDPDFAAFVDTTKYHVFLTGLDGRFDLSVEAKTPGGFRVKAATATEGTFAWRVVARRKDIAAPRFETVEIPKEPTLPPVPASVHDPMPSPPDMPRRGGPRRPNGKP